MKPKCIILVKIKSTGLYAMDLTNRAVNTRISFIVLVEQDTSVIYQWCHVHQTAHTLNYHLR